MNRNFAAEKQALLREIESLKRKLSEARAELRRIEGNERLALQPEVRQKLRFFNMRPTVAAEIVIGESPDQRLHVDDLTTILLEGGIAVGRKRSHNNVRIGLDKAIELKVFAIDGDGFISKTRPRTVLRS